MNNILRHNKTNYKVSIEVKRFQRRPSNAANSFNGIINSKIVRVYK